MPNQLWSIGGTVTMNTAPVTGTQLLIQRTLPFTQETSIQNQGNYYSQVVEQALDTLEMQIQQLAGRTTQFQGIWTTNTMYTVGDIVQDGANGNDTLSYYICQIANTSGVWATDLANGDWAISVQAVIPSSNQPITLSGAVTGTGTNAITTTLANNIVTNVSLVSGAVSLSKLANIGPNTVLCNPSATSATPTTIALSSGNLVGMDGGNVAAISLGYGLSLQTNTLAISQISFASSLLNDVSLNNTSNYFDGPTISQGTSGTWFASGTVTVSSSNNGETFDAKLWDGATVISSVQVENSSNDNAPFLISLSGVLTNPAGNIRISVRDATNTSANIKANASGNAKDSTITAFRIV